MRRLTRELQEWHQVKSDRAMRDLQRANLRRSKRGKPPNNGKKPFATDVVLVQPPKRLVYHAPRKIRDLFEKFVDTVNRNLEAGRRVTIDFREVTRLYPCGVLLIMGLVDHWNAAYPNMMSAKYPKDDLAEQMLQHVEVLQKLQLKPRKTVDHQDVKRWHYFTGREVDPMLFADFMDDVARCAGEETQSGLFECISEALTNVKHHAYQAGGETPWWAFATVSEKKIFIAVHDRGASIPSTVLQKPKLLEMIRHKILRRNIDGDLISSTMGGRSRTELPYRGKGLPEMYGYTKANAKSELGIYSRGGYFRYIPQYAQSESHGTLKQKVEGTLIMWLVSLEGESL